MSQLPLIRALGTSTAHKASPQTDTLAQRALEEWERTLCENKVAILAGASQPTSPNPERWWRNAHRAKALVDDPAAFIREMTRVLREKQSHPLLAQMMKPAESSDPPPANAAFSGSGSTSQPCSFSKLLELTWGIHGWHNIRHF